MAVRLRLVWHQCISRLRLLIDREINVDNKNDNLLYDLQHFRYSNINFSIVFALRAPELR